MKIEIKNLGAVKSATIDISKKLNLFCGPNGTGKTYVAYAIYDIFRSDFHIGTNEIFDNIVEHMTLITPITIPTRYNGINLLLIALKSYLNNFNII